METEYHEGKPSLLMTQNRVVVLCPHGHVVESMPTQEWARSKAEAGFQDRIVRCGGTK